MLKLLAPTLTCCKKRSPYLLGVHKGHHIRKCCLVVGNAIWALVQLTVGDFAELELNGCVSGIHGARRRTAETTLAWPSRLSTCLGLSTLATSIRFVRGGQLAKPQNMLWFIGERAAPPKTKTCQGQPDTLKDTFQLRPKQHRTHTAHIYVWWCLRCSKDRIKLHCLKFNFKMQF